MIPRIKLFLVSLPLLMLFMCGRASANYTVVASCKGPNNSTSPQSCTATIPAHSLIYVSIWIYGGFGFTVSDTFGLSYATTTISGCAVQQAGPSQDFLWGTYAYNGTSSGSDTITITSVSSLVDLTVTAYNTGLDSGAPDTTGACGTGTAGSPSSANYTTTRSNELIIGSGEAIATTISAGSGYSFNPSPINEYGTGGWLPIEDKLGASAGVYTATITQNAGSSPSPGVWALLCIGFPTANSQGVPRHLTGFY